MCSFSRISIISVAAVPAFVSLLMVRIMTIRAAATRIGVVGKPWRIADIG
jgi:hypothetical protein